MDNFNNGQALSNASIAPAQLGCDRVCDVVVDSLRGELIGLNGGPGWSQADDQWCADHQVGTNPTVFASPRPQPSASGTPRVQCNVPLLYGDSSCETVNRKLTHCKLHGSQIETQCLAYATTKEASKSEKVVLAFDITATAMCATACASQVFGGFLIPACNIAGAAASGAEIIQNLTSKSSGMQKIVGSLGAGYGAINAVNGIGAARAAGTAAKEWTRTAVDGRAAWTNGSTINYSQTNPGAASGAGNGPSAGAKKNACIAAATFGALTGLRVFNMKKHGDTKKKACEAVQDLVSNSFAPGFTVPVIGATNFAGNVGNSGNSGNSGGSGNTSNSGGTSATSSSVRTSNALLGNGDCTGANCFSETLDRVAGGGNQNAATDAGLLKSSGLAKLLANQAASLPMDKFMKHIENGGSADALIGAALGGQGGSFGQGVAALAKQAQQDGALLGGGEGAPALASTPAGGGGMAGAGGRGPSNDENPFKLMGQGDQNLGGNQNVNFAKGPELNGAEIGQDGDIYHSNFGGSIFEIVSHKIRKTTDRVEPLNYALPMNRALTGQR